MRSEWMKKKGTPDRIIWVLFAGIVGLRTVLTVIYGLPYFDGGMNLQVPLSLIENGTYSTLYNGGTLFDIAIQTGVPVLVPIYVMFLVFGIGTSQALFVNAVYLVVFLWLVNRICRQAGMDGRWRMICLMLIFLVRKIYEYSMGIYGEVPAAVWFLFCVFFLMKQEETGERKWLCLSGLCYGLALLTKTVLFIAVPALLVVFLSKIFLEKRLKIKNVICWAVSCIVPYAAFLIYKFCSLGSNEFRTLTERLMGGIMKQAGVKSGYSDTAGNIFRKFAAHMGVLSDYLKLHELLLFLILAVNLLYFGYHIIKRGYLLYFELLALVAYSYFGWWLLITPTAKAWERRIFIGILLMIITIVWNVSRSAAADRLKDRNRAFVLVLSCLLAGVYIRQVPELLKIDYGEKAALEKDGEYIRGLAEQEPDAVFCGNGWWQAPNVSFFAGITFMDVNETEGENLYYIRGKYEKLLGEDTLSELERTIELQQIYSNETSETEIYKVTGRKPYREFSEEEYEQAQLDAVPKDCTDDSVRGLNSYEEDTKNRWAEENVGILLDMDPEDERLEFDYRIVNIDQMDVKPVEITVYVNEEEVYSRMLDRDGRYKALIDVSDFSGEEYLEVHIVSNGSIAAEGDDRELSYLFEGLYLR